MTRRTYYKATRPNGTDFYTGTVDYGAALIPADGIRLVFGRDRLPEYQRTCPAWPTEGQVEGRRRAAFSRFTNKARADAIAFLAAHPDYQPIQRPGWRWPGLDEGIAWNKWGGWI